MSLTNITHCFGLKRDPYYKYKSRTDKRLILKQQIINIVKKDANLFLEKMCLSLQNI
jgi:hypothetical protein